MLPFVPAQLPNRQISYACRGHHRNRSVFIGEPLCLGHLFENRHSIRHQSLPRIPVAVSDVIGSLDNWQGRSLSLGVRGPFVWETNSLTIGSIGIRFSPSNSPPVKTSRRSPVRLPLVDPPCHDRNQPVLIPLGMQQSLLFLPRSLLQMIADAVLVFICLPPESRCSTPAFQTLSRRLSRAGLRKLGAY